MQFLPIFLVFLLPCIVKCQNFADEFEDEKTGYIKPAEFGRGLLEPALDSPDRVDAASERYFAEFRNSMRTNRESIPDGYSSVRNGYVSPVRNQKQCGKNYKLVF